MQDSLSAQVAGSSTIFPRGYLWQAPFWCALAVAWLVLSSWPPLWFRAGAVVGLLCALITFLAVMSSLNVTAFTADQTGVWLGLPPFTRRHGKLRTESTYVSWEHIERVRMRTRPTGVQLEIILNQNTHLAMLSWQYPPAQRAVRWLAMLIPFWYLRRRTALTTPLDKPPRFELTLRGKTIEELRPVIRALAPPDVGVALLMRKS